MYKNQRQNLLLEYILEKKELTFRQLAEKFNVSEMTIRRDISQMENNQLIEKTVGGVVAKSFKKKVTPIEYREHSHMDEKNIIASIAAEYIEEGDIIVLDSGTTVYQLAAKLTDMKDLTVFTNDFNIFNLLKECTGIKTILGGGEVMRGYDYLVTGYYNQLFYENIRVDKAFIGALAIELQSGIFTSSLEVALSRKGIMKAAQQTYILASYDKFNSNSLYRIAPIEDIDYIITDNKFGRNKYQISEDINIIQSLQ